MTLTQADRDAIYENHGRYVWCLDNGDVEGLVATFSADATIKDITGRTWSSARDFATNFITTPHMRGAGQHWVQHLSVDEKGPDECVVTSYWFSARRNPDEPAQIRTLGRYLDTCVRVDGTWLMKEKRIDPWNSDTIAALGNDSRRLAPAETSQEGVMQKVKVDSKVRRAIYDNLARYAWSLDRCDLEGVLSTFTKNGAVQSRNSRSEGPDGLREFAERVFRQPNFKGRQHRVQPLFIEEVNGDLVLTSYWLAVDWPAGGVPTASLLGYYRDTCANEDGLWLSKEKVIDSWAPGPVDLPRDGMSDWTATASTAAPGISEDDRQAIIDLMYGYAWNLDRNQPEGVAAVFTDDGIIRSQGPNRWEGTEQLKAFVTNAHRNPGLDARQHHIQPISFEKDGDGYIATSYWMALNWNAGTPPTMFSKGYYLDVCVKQRGEWRIKDKAILRWSNESAPMANE